MNTFDLGGTLPEGTAVLEASAGTGKTFSIAALATRFLAEGVVTIDQLMIVTFSRVATQHLRAAVRDRIATTARYLDTTLAAADTPATNEVEKVLGTGAPIDLDRRRVRLDEALSDFDRATIMTTHEFCHGMMRGLGVLASQEPPTQFVEDISPLVTAVAQDHYLARFATHPDRVRFDYAEPSSLGKKRTPGAVTLARAAMTSPDASLVPTDAAGDVMERVGFAAAIRNEVTRRKQQLGWITFDDMLLGLRDSLLDPETGPRACARIRERYRVVLVDEFQDTDPIQWQILSEAFHQHATLVLIGDPKQAIYAFRGADVDTYRMAVTAPGARTETMTTNFRADPGMVKAVSSLFDGVLVGDGITVPPVVAHRSGSRLSAGTSPLRAPLRIRTITDDKPLRIAAARQRIIEDLVQQVAALLASDIRYTPDGGSSRPVEPRDIAVLVRKNVQGRAIAEALTRAGIPAAFSGAEGVFSSQAATDWLTLLAALENPRSGLLRAAMLTPFVGATFADLATGDDDVIAPRVAQLKAWGQIVRQSGVAALVAAIESDTDLAARVLSQPMGERLLTDYRHLSQLMHDEATRRGLDPTRLRSWLESEVAAENGQSDTVRRLETDADTVQIMSIHRSKGLEFPIVMLPEASDGVTQSDDGQVIDLHVGGKRVKDVGGKNGPGRAQRFATFTAEAADEDLRTLYVALTRAQCHVTCWWADTERNTAGSALHRLLFRQRTGDPTVPDLRYPSNARQRVAHPATLTWLAEAGILVDRVDAGEVRASARTPAPAEPLSARTWTRTIDREWRRTSYSGLTAGTHDHIVDQGLDDEATAMPDEASPDVTTTLVEGPASPMADLPGGPAFGTLIHAVLERCDVRDPDAVTNLPHLCATQLARIPVVGVDPEHLAQALLPTLSTPLGPLTDGRSLAELPERLNELDFELPLGSADGTAATLHDIAARMAHSLPAGHPLASYPAMLAHLPPTRLRGFLTGSIDSVLRVPGASPRYVIVDYKTNRLSADPVLRLAHYGQPAMAEAMMASHYPLQALLYSVALHRFLGSRMREYDPKVHLGGVLYLFVRGMGGADTTEGTGIFAWQPTTDLVESVSRLLAFGPSGSKEVNS